MMQGLLPGGGDDGDLPPEFPGIPTGSLAGRTRHIVRLVDLPGELFCVVRFTHRLRVDDKAVVVIGDPMDVLGCVAAPGASHDGAARVRRVDAFIVRERGQGLADALPQSLLADELFIDPGPGAPDPFTFIHLFAPVGEFFCPVIHPGKEFSLAAVSCGSFPCRHCPALRPVNKEDVPLYEVKSHAHLDGLAEDLLEDALVSSPRLGYRLVAGLQSPGEPGAGHVVVALPLYPAGALHPVRTAEDKEPEHGLRIVFGVAHFVGVHLYAEFRKVEGLDELVIDPDGSPGTNSSMPCGM